MSTPTRQTLDGTDWTVRAVGDLGEVPPGIRGRAIPATVPGCVHTDLIDAGAIADPRIGLNEELALWVGRTDWAYDLTFRVSRELLSRERVELVFGCLDTIAAVTLNGRSLGNAASEFLPHRFPAKQVLVVGTNTLSVRFTSPVKHAHAEAARLGPLPVNGDWDPYPFVRKCASNFQWDWGPRAATCGISDEAAIEAWDIARIDGVWLALNDTAISGRVALQRSGAGDPALRIRSRVVDPTGRIVAEADDHVPGSAITTELRWTCDRIAPWKPRGESEGPRALYRLELELLHNGTVIDRWRGSTGFRSVTLDPVSMDLRLSGVSIFCKGANWIPEGLWPRDRSRERVRQRLEQAAAANMNMVRVWGGGRYEPDWFYDICDELGIMVWHDFMFACGCYPEEEPIRSLVESEARYQVARLSRHPCVVLWCGGNEDIWAYESWGFKDKVPSGRTWGEGYWRRMLPAIVGERAPSPPYRPDSPWSGDAEHPNSAETGDRHTWDLMGDAFRTHVPRFCSEFGVQSPSTMDTLRDAHLLEGETSGVVPGALAKRQRGPGGMLRWYDEPLATLFQAAGCTQEWIGQAHDMQARWLSLAIVWLRANRPRCRGALLWQLNDAWPGLSWSLIDSEGKPKPAYSAVQRAFQPRLIELVPFDGELCLVGINDEACEWDVTAQVSRRQIGGAVLATSLLQMTVAPRSAFRVPLNADLRTPTDPRREELVAHSAGQSATWRFLPDKDLVIP